MPNPTPDSYVFTPGVTLYVGMPTPGGDLLTTLTLVNTSGSEQAANFVAPMFGQPFVQGDVPSGQYPQFELTDGTPCPATIHSVTTWPDGSMKWCGVLMRVPTTIAGSGSLTINVKNGGSAPSASSRTTGDLTAADLSTVLTGVTNLTGEWTASLNTAITDADDIVMIGDGPAGRIWRIGGPFKQSGSPHGQLHCWHYVAALQNSSNGLLGLRYLGRAVQPWADVTSPAVAKRVFTGVFKSGSTTLRTLQAIQSNGSTVGTDINLPHYADLYTAGTDAKWDFVQGGGSASADCTVRVQHDKTYFTKTREVPAYDLTQSPTSSASVDYYAQCKGSHQTYATGDGGERVEIGIFPSWVVRHLMTQAAVDERAVRVSALATGGWRNCVRLSTTRAIVPVVDIQASYTGLGTAQPTWALNDGLAVGFNAFSATHLWTGEFEPSHRSNAAFYAYLITGEPQYLDLVVEQASSIITGRTPGSGTWKIGSPITGGDSLASGTGNRAAVVDGVTYKAGGMFLKRDLLRIPAWGTRDVAQAAAIYPDTCPYGSAVRTYFRDVMENGYDAVNDYNTKISADWAASGLMSFSNIVAGSDGSYESPWATGFMSNSVCHQENILPGLGALTLRQHLAKLYAGVHAAGDIAGIGSYRYSQWRASGVRIERAEEVLFMASSSVFGSFSCSTTDSRFTKTSTWTATAGDIISFSDNLGFPGEKPFAAAVDDERFYVVNVSGNTFQLAATPGGSPITVTSNVSFTRWMCRLADAGTLYSFNADYSPDGYLANLYSAIRSHLACGDTVVSAARTAQDANLTGAAVSFAADPKNAMAAAYPS